MPTPRTGSLTASPQGGAVSTYLGVREVDQPLAVAVVLADDEHITALSWDVVRASDGASVKFLIGRGAPTWVDDTINFKLGDGVHVVDRETYTAVFDVTTDLPRTFTVEAGPIVGQRGAAASPNTAPGSTGLPPVSVVVLQPALDAEVATRAAADVALAASITGGALTGPPGPTGAKGDKGDKGDAGPAGLNFRGVWDAAIANYTSTGVAGADEVTYLPNGNAYVAKVASIPAGALPTNTSYWTLLVLQGAPGATGATGLTGAKGDKGDKGDTGLTGARGDAGVAGPAGLNFRGVWSPSISSYTSTGVQGADEVTYATNGNAYFATQPSIPAGTLPTNTAYWSLLVMQGAPGPAGTPGASVDATTTTRGGGLLPHAQVAAGPVVLALNEDVTAVATTANNAIPLSQKAAPSGVAALGIDSTISAAQMQGTMPSQLDRSLRSVAGPTAVGVGSPVTLYTVPSGANKMLRWVRVAYLAAADQTLTLTIVPADGSTTDTITLGTVVPANSARALELYTSLLPGDIIQAQGSSAQVTVELFCIDLGGGAQALRLATSLPLVSSPTSLQTSLDRMLVTEVRCLNTGAGYAGPLAYVARSSGGNSVLSWVDTAVPPAYYGPLALQEPVPMTTGDILKLNCAQAGVQATVSAIVFTNVPTLAAPVPDEYATLYAYQQAEVNALIAALGSLTPVVGAPTTLTQSCDLLAASANIGHNLIADPAYLTGTVYKNIDALYRLGVRGVTIAMGYPICSPDNILGIGEYNNLMTFYGSVFTYLTGKGMTFTIKAGLTFSSVSLAGIGFAAYCAKKHTMVQDLVTRFAPPRIQILSEPDTEVNLLIAAGALTTTGDNIQQLATPAGAASYVATVMSGLTRTAATKVFAGQGTWLPATFTQAIASAAATTGLDGIALHVYPLSGTYSGGVATGSIKNLLDCIGYMHTYSLRGIIDEAGLYKSATTETTGIAATYTVYGRDVWDFWASLDALFYTTLRNMCRQQGIELVSWFWISRYAFYQYAYTQALSQQTYNQLTAPSSPMTQTGAANFLAYAATALNANLSALGLLAKAAYAG